MSADPAAAAALRFAGALSATGGHVSSIECKEIRDAGFTDAAIVEIAAVVAANVFANFVNNLADAVPDLPAMPLPKDAGARAR